MAYESEENYELSIMNYERRPSLLPSPGVPGEGERSELHFFIIHNS
jgi:hypothetical protein